MSYNGTAPIEPPLRILAVRLGAMGDVIHALPAVARLKCSFPQARLTWAVESQWSPLLDGNPYIDEVLPLPISDWRRRFGVVTWREFQDVRTSLRASRFDLAVDFQGLLKSALVTFFSRADRVVGFERDQLREPIAASFYSDRVPSEARHVVRKNLDLASAVGGREGPIAFPLPPGKADPTLPRGEFVLASPVAGWTSKQWPPEHYAELARLLWKHRRIPLVLDCAPRNRAYAEEICNRSPSGSAVLHTSSLGGLIGATRRARAVVGVDSGPLHLASALGIGGVAIYGRTDPARNGPFGNGFVVLRVPEATTSYKRGDEIDDAMRQIGPEKVWGSLDGHLSGEKRPAPRAVSPP